ncbi:PREDICTED: zinc metalloproteinase nas-15-like [Trachymyrmex cornetzi]|uniref:zinc metalloproteinase nas-15-like n=1 Tax=Trachymyrmex cornetzi TaxID=471704 RepID=UPI00084F5548|nr:PREDICTED: zinc metalloproteinase nas-15-like [Trachymyrmex cornetzi]
MSVVDKSFVYKQRNSTLLCQTFSVLIQDKVIGVSSGLPAKSHRGSHGHSIPPVPRFNGVFDHDHNHEKIANNIKSWSPNNLQNVWELSGLYEGDIMIHPDSPMDSPWKNGLLDATARWPGGVVPYFIQEDDFDRDQIELIKEAMQEYHERTCLRFRPYKDTDDDYVTIQAKDSGCWSLVGRHGHGQVLNLQNPGCIHHGVVVHELMHALGFYHQQSAANRDEWVTIHWENIKLGKEHNFNKYDNRTVTDYGIGYDYKSVMHYSSHAFSKNGEPTITPKKEKVQLGQRDGLSKKDVAKVQAMYKEQCDNRNGSHSFESSKEISMGWLFD